MPPDTQPGAAQRMQFRDPKDGQVYAVRPDKMQEAHKRGLVPIGPTAFNPPKPVQTPLDKMRSTGLGRFESDVVGSIGFDPAKIAEAGEKGDWAANKEVFSEFGSGASKFLRQLAMDPAKALASVPEGGEELIWKMLNAKSPGEFIGAASSLSMMIEAPEKGNLAAKGVARGALGIGKTGLENAFQKLDSTINEAKQSNVTRMGQQFAGDLYTRMAGQMGDAAEVVRENVRKLFNGAGGRWDQLTKAVGDRDVNFTPVKVAQATARRFLENPALAERFDRVLKDAGFPKPKEFLDTPSGAEPTVTRPTTIPYGKARQIYTQLGEALDRQTGFDPADFSKLSTAVGTLRKALLPTLEAAEGEAGMGGMAKALRKEYHEFKSAFDDQGAPLRQLIDAETSPHRESVLGKFAFDDTLAGLLNKFGSIGGNPNLATQLRSVTRLMDEHSVQALKDVPKMPSPEEWRRTQIRNRSQMYTDPTRMDLSVLGSATAPMRRFLGWALHKKAIEDWLAQGK